MSNLKDALTKHINKTSWQVNLLRGTCEAVDKGKKTCDVLLDNGALIEGVLLQVVSELGPGITFYPKVKTQVLIEKIESKDMALKLHSCTEIESIELIMDDKIAITIVKDTIKLVIGGTTLKLKDNQVELDSSNITMNGGSLGGLVKVQGLLSRLNAIEQWCNTHIHTSASPGSPTSPPVSPLAPGTTLTDIENTKIKQ